MTTWCPHEVGQSTRPPFSPSVQPTVHAYSMQSPGILYPDSPAVCSSDQLLYLPLLVDTHAGCQVHQRPFQLERDCALPPGPLVSTSVPDIKDCNGNQAVSDLQVGFVDTSKMRPSCATRTWLATYGGSEPDIETGAREALKVEQEANKLLPVATPRDVRRLAAPIMHTVTTCQLCRAARTQVPPRR